MRVEPPVGSSSGDDHGHTGEARCDAKTESGTPCQKRGPHGGHWFMSDDLWACLGANHFDPANVLSMTPLAHLDVPCPRRAEVSS
jgi:hypothetical protein